MDLLRKVATERRTAVIVVTHDEKIFERFDQIYALRDGALAAPRIAGGVITQRRRRRPSLSRESADSARRCFLRREFSGPDVDLNGRQQKPWRGQRRVALGPHRDEFVFRHAFLHVNVLLALLPDGRLPRIVVAPGRLVVVAHEQSRLGRQRLQPLDRAVELVRVAAGEIGARRAVVRHEQRVADKYRVLDLVGNVRRRVAGRVQNLGVQRRRS